MKKPQACPFILIVGPTGVGKSSFATQLAERLDGEIINADMGQLYEPLTVGTAKPSWKSEKVPHHGFDILHKPCDYNVIQYRSFAEKCIKEITSRNKVPLIVGGSCFYWNGLFFPPQDFNDYQKLQGEHLTAPFDYTGSEEVSWELLNTIDSERAQEIHCNDVYRITRAINLWRSSGRKPSLLKPQYHPLRQNFLIIAVSRPKPELNERIDMRVDEMLSLGWVNETQSLDASWKEFLLRKKIIGYDDIIMQEIDAHSITRSCVDRIKQRTRQYARRQNIYWKSWKKKFELKANGHQRYCELSLTLSSFDLYLKQLNPIFKDLGVALL